MASPDESPLITSISPRRFERDGDIECSTIWENSVLSSVTHLHMADEAGETSGTHGRGEPS